MRKTAFFDELIYNSVYSDSGDLNEVQKAGQNAHNARKGVNRALAVF
jgi:hypothetical protein